MELQLQEAVRQYQQSKLVCQTWGFAVDIIQTLLKRPNSPNELSRGFLNLKIMAVPAGQGTIDLLPLSVGRIEGYPSVASMGYSSVTPTELPVSTMKPSVSHIGYSFPPPAFPLGSNVIIPTSQNVMINIQPEPISVLQSMNISFIHQPTNIKMTIVCQMTKDGDPVDCKILTDENGLLQNYDEEKPTNIMIPEAMLEELVKQIEPYLNSRILSITDEEDESYFSFNWPVYLVIPPNS